MPTCNKSVYDFFVIPRTLSPAVVGVQVIRNDWVRPHWPVRLLLAANMRRLAVRTIVRPKKAVPLAAVRGCAPAPASFCDTHALLDSARADGIPPVPDDLFNTWLREARVELASVDGLAKLHHNVRYKFTTAIGRMADPCPGSTASSRAWRSLASIASYLGEVIVQGLWGVSDVRNAAASFR